MNYSAEVKSNLEFLKTKGIWHVVSTNDRVETCADAAQRRNRLGHKGIPLFDELKTNVGICESDGRTTYVAAHCRGNQFLDKRVKLPALLGCGFKRLPPERLAEVFGSRKGLVNPFGLARNSDIKHVFDKTILEPYFPPYTMMTNLGDFNVGVEFYPSDVVQALNNKIVGDIVTAESGYVPTEHRFGILTGNGPESGIMLWESINKSIRRNRTIFRGDISFPAVFIESSPGMGLSMELAQREKYVRPVVLDGVRRLCDQGSTVIGIACNTTQYFSDDVKYECEKYGARFVSIAEETALYLQQERINSFDFLGIGPVSDFGKWSAFGQALAGFDVHMPSEAELKEISDLAYHVKREVVTGRTINGLRDLINKDTTTKTNVVVLALTELSIVFASQKQKSEKRFVDTLEVLAERMASIYIDEYLRVPKIASIAEDS